LVPDWDWVVLVKRMSYLWLSHVRHCTDLKQLGEQMFAIDRSKCEPKRMRNCNHFCGYGVIEKQGTRFLSRSVSVREMVHHNVRP
jgi:hypothetical protein